MKYYIIAGEASGDMHGANLIHAIQELDSQASFQFFGGDKMEKIAQTKAIKHISDLAFMGFIEVVLNLRIILKNISLCKKTIVKFQPDALILIDYPGFNLRIAQWAKQQRIKVFYYISPQIWAWKSKRIHSIINSTEEVYTILPFEKDFYKKYNYNVVFVGHPLLDEISKNNFNKIASQKPIVALLPGSRKQEISNILPIMIDAVKNNNDYDFIIGAAPSIPDSFYQKIINKHDIKIEKNNTHGLLHSSYAALVTSGTATLETALFNVPQIVCYKGSKISYWIAKKLIKNINYISLVNLILNRSLVKELIQENLNSQLLKKEFNDLLVPQNRKIILEGYQELKQMISKKNASKNVAEDIIKKIRN